MMLAEAKLAASITFIVLASCTIVTYDHQNMFIIQATGPRPRTKRVKNDCTLSADYYITNYLNYYILYYYLIINYGEPSQPKREMELLTTLF